MNEAKNFLQEDVFTEQVNAKSKKAAWARRVAEAEAKRKAANAIVKKAVIFAMVGGAVMTFGILGWMQEWFSDFITAGCGLCSMFNVGYYFGAIRGIKI